MIDKIKSIKQIKKVSKRYDIQVADHANFFANNILVHNCTLATTYYHARSIDSGNHESRNWLKRFHGNIAYNIPDGMRICGENMYARHSIAYDNLPSYFLGFSIWDNDICLSWDDTLEYFRLLDIHPVTVLYRGVWNELILRSLSRHLNLDKQEGFVVRFTAAFKHDEFAQRVAKWVRGGHVQTDEHWMHKEVIPNKLKV